MSITIRLTRTGRKNLPSYRVVVSNTRSKRDGKVLDIIGFYNPSMKPIQFELNKEKMQEWEKKGALKTEAVEKLINNKYEYIPYAPKSKKQTDSSGENA